MRSFKTPDARLCARDSPAHARWSFAVAALQADFGVAKAGCDTDGSMAGTTVGTPHYLSPEMCEGKRYGKKTDMWALGCILYELCSLKKAFEASNIGGERAANWTTCKLPAVHVAPTCSRPAEQLLC